MLSSPFFLHNLREGGGLMNLVNFRDLLRLVSCLLPENLFVYTYLGGHVSNVCGCLRRPENMFNCLELKL